MKLESYKDLSVEESVSPDELLHKITIQQSHAVQDIFAKLVREKIGIKDNSDQEEAKKAKVLI